VKPRKQPRQARAAATVDAIVEAAARILERGSLDQVNTNAIAKRAGVSIGSLYQYFSTKEGILAALIRREHMQLRENIIEAAEAGRDQSFEEATEALLGAAVAHKLDRPRLHRALEYAEAVLPLDAEAHELNALIVGRVVELFVIHGIDEPKETARDVVALAKGMIDAARTAGETDHADLQRRLKRAVFGYLRGPVSPTIAR